MHTLPVAVFALVIAAVGPSVSAAAEPAPVKAPSEDMQWKCQDVPEHGRVCVPAGEMAAKAVGSRKCSWKCIMERGVEVCRGSGPECNGKIPPHWK